MRNNLTIWELSNVWRQLMSDVEVDKIVKNPMRTQQNILNPEYSRSRNRLDRYTASN
jgi:hypothetical protein